MKDQILMEGGNLIMDELYTVEEMTKILKVSRETLYRFMNDGKIPYVRIGSHRRFIARQVNKAIRDMQLAQQREEIYGEMADNRKENKPVSSALNDTLWDVRKSSSSLKPSNSKHLQHLRKQQYKLKKHPKRT
jgi:excisionase family DNA binding protein